MSAQDQEVIKLREQLYQSTKPMFNQIQRALEQLSLAVSNFSTDDFHNLEIELPEPILDRLSIHMDFLKRDPFSERSGFRQKQIEWRFQQNNFILKPKKEK